MVCNDSVIVGNLFSYVCIFVEHRGIKDISYCTNLLYHPKNSDFEEHIFIYNFFLEILKKI